MNSKTKKLMANGGSGASTSATRVEGRQPSYLGLTAQETIVLQALIELREDEEEAREREQIEEALGAKAAS